MYGMTFNDMLDQGIDFQSEVRLCYYDYRRGERILANSIANAKVYDMLYNQPIKYIYADKEPGESGEQVVYIEVENPYDDEE